MKKNQPKRKLLRLQNYDYSMAGAYFITLCVKNREHLLGEIVNGEMKLNKFGEIVNEKWFDLPNYYTGIELCEWVVMPNHVHGILVFTENVGAIHELPASCEPFQQWPTHGAIRELPLHLQRRKMLLPKIVGRLKMTSAKAINEARQTPGVPFWQRNYYEHIIRNDDDYASIANYILHNPSHWENDRFHVS